MQQEKEKRQIFSVIDQNLVFISENFNSICCIIYISICKHQM